MPRRLALAPSVVLLSVAFSQEASANELDFSIPAGRLADVLASFARQTSFQILFKADDVAGETSSGVDGRMSPQQAIDIILRGTRLSERRFGPKTIALVRRPLKTRVPGHRLLPATPVPTATISGPCRYPDADPGSAGPEPCITVADITVTGDRLISSLHDTPGAIAVLGGDELEGYNIRSLVDLGAGSVPALRVSPFGGRPSALTLGMRGMVPIDPAQITRDPTVGVYMNGVYLGRVQGLGAYSLDVERVEILRGPQGTMFGRNAIGGAINIITKKPSGKFSVRTKLGFSSFSGREGSIRVDLPEQHGVSASVTALLDLNAGWVRNPLPGEANWHRMDRRALSASLLWRPADNLELQYDWDRSTDAGTPGYSTLMSLDEADLPIAPMFSVEGDRVRRARGGFMLKPSEGRVSGHAFRGSYRVSDSVSINAVGSWRSLVQEQWDQSAGIFFGFVPGGESGRLSYAKVRQTQFNGEVSIGGKLEDIQYLAGYFKFTETGQDRAKVANTVIFNNEGNSYFQKPGIDLGAMAPDRWSEARTNSQALFGRAAWTPRFADRRFTIDAGVRYTSETKRGRPGAANETPGSVDGPPLPVIYSGRRLDPAISLAFAVDEHNRVYAKWSRAFRAGGANTRSPTFRRYAAEVISSWELGYKARLLDGTLELNLAAYASALKNPQIDVANYANISRIETVNGTKPIRIRGFEAEAQLDAIHGVVIDASLTLTRIQGGVQEVFVDVVSNRIPVAVSYAPQFAANLSVSKDIPLGSRLSAQLQVYGNIRGRERTAINGELSSPASNLGSRLDIKGLKMRSADLKLGFWVKNLLNERHEIWSYHKQWPTAFDLRIFNDPRSMGVTLSAAI